MIWLSVIFSLITIAALCWIFTSGNGDHRSTPRERRNLGEGNADTDQIA